VLERDYLRSDTRVTEIAETCKLSDLSVVGFGNVKREYRGVAEETQKDARCVVTCERIRKFCPHQAELDRRVRVLRSEKKRLEAPHREHQRGWIAPLGFDPILIGALFAGAIEWTTGKRNHSASPRKSDHKKGAVQIAAPFTFCL
jgi:hypothetical protein